MGISLQLSPSKPFCPLQNRIRLVLPCGTVCDFNEAMSATEALHSSCLLSLTDLSDKSFNNFLMCDSASLRVGKRACPVHPDMQLELGHLYYVLPIQTYQHRLAWSHISALADMAMPSSCASATTPSSILPSSATTLTHAAVYYNESSPSKISKQCVVPRTFSRIPGLKFYLCLLFHRRLLFKGTSRVNDTHTASCRSYNKGAPMRSFGLDTEGRGAERAAEMMIGSKGRGSTWKLNNICESSEANSKYVELLIERSNSWRPPLQTIQESLSV